LTSASRIKIFSLTTSLNKIPVSIPIYQIVFLEYRNTGIAKHRRYWRPYLSLTNTEAHVVDVQCSRFQSRSNSASFLSIELQTNITVITNKHYSDPKSVLWWRLQSCDV